MSTISKRKHKHFDIEAYYRNESRTFLFGLLISGTKAKSFDLVRKILYHKQIISALALQIWDEKNQFNLFQKLSYAKLNVSISSKNL
jgi:hypothetical protein